jgi:MFS superfamily sulfate permease-like transporter
MDRTALLRGDLLAGLTAAAVVTPQAMAYASIAAVPPKRRDPGHLKLRPRV